VPGGERGKKRRNLENRDRVNQAGENRERLADDSTETQAKEDKGQEENVT